ncbi:MAG: TRAP transporter large permease [Brooklawnia sp.]|uniref:TRAP transporter large permease n=1 Tax=Brooklawnia sp. TaxID=2699740 RepID=UPI003C74D664
MGGPLLALFLGGIIMRIPIGFALAAASMGVLFIMTDYPLQVGAQRIVAGITPFGLLAIPLFILAGGLMGAGGLTKRMLAFAEVLVGGMRGGLAQTTMLASLIFGGISGSSVANLSSLGRIMTPAMISRGYTRGYTAAVNATAPVNDPIMPPSITMIVFGVVTGTSIGNLFFAGIVPAFIFIGLMMLVVHFTVLKQGFTDEVKAKAANPKDIGKIAKEDRPSASKAFVEAIPALIMPVIILVGIRGGFFTPTEAAAVAVVYALLVGLLYRELTFKTLIYGMIDSAITVGLIMLVLAAAQLYSWALTAGRVPEQIADALFSVSDNKYVILLMMNVLLLIAGMFLEANAALIIIAPILLPVALAIGMDPVHLGIVVVVNMSIGLITPPVGIVLMLAAALAKVSMVKAIKAVLPFLGVMLIYLMLITYVPEISLWLPRVLL